MGYVKFSGGIFERGVSGRRFEAAQGVEWRQFVTHSVLTIIHLLLLVGILLPPGFSVNSYNPLCFKQIDEYYLYMSIFFRFFKALLGYDFQW